MVIVMANSRNSRPTRPPISRIGTKTAISDTLIDSTVKPTSLDPSSAACSGGFPASRWREMFSSTTMASSTTNPVATVSAISEKMLRLYPSRYMTAKVATSDTDIATTGASVARAAAQERKHHEDDQNHGDDQRDLDVAQRGPDRDRAVDREIDVDRGRDRCAQLRHQRLHAVDHPDDVGARLPVDDHHDRPLAVGKSEIAQVLHGIEHLADVGEAHRRAVAIGDHQRFVVRRLDGLIVGIDLVALVADVDAALRTVGIGAAERRADIFQADAVFVERLWREFDAHRGQRSTADADFADAFDLRQLLRQHGRSGVIEFGGGQRVRRQRIDQDRRRGRVELAVGGIAPQRGRQVGARGVDRRLDVARGAVDVAVDAELQVDTRGAERAR